MNPQSIKLSGNKLVDFNNCCNIILTDCLVLDTLSENYWSFSDYKIQKICKFAFFKSELIVTTQQIAS